MVFPIENVIYSFPYYKFVMAASECYGGPPEGRTSFHFFIYLRLNLKNGVYDFVASESDMMYFFQNAYMNFRIAHFSCLELSLLGGSPKVQVPSFSELF